jgi:hypothetical protein
MQVTVSKLIIQVGDGTHRPMFIKMPVSALIILKQGEQSLHSSELN